MSSASGIPQSPKNGFFGMTCVGNMSFRRAQRGGIPIMKQKKKGSLNKGWNGGALARTLMTVVSGIPQSPKNGFFGMTSRRDP